MSLFKSGYLEIESPKDIRRLNRNLSTRLRRSCTTVEERTIGSQRGNFTVKVRFAPQNKDKAFYWFGDVSENGQKGINIFGHGIPGTNAPLKMDVLAHLTIAKYSRRYGGAFLRHEATGNIFLAHRGIATLGRQGRVPKSELLKRMSRFRVTATTSKGDRQFLLMSSLESPQLLAELDRFSLAFREAVKSSQTASDRSRSNRTKPVTRRFFSSALRDYFKEYIGVLKIKGRTPSVGDTHHGAVVDAIKRRFGRCATFKNQAIDLAVIKGNTAILFEVKTSIRTQPIFTAVGQLSIQAVGIAERFSASREFKGKLVKVLVLPKRLDEPLAHVLEKDLEIKLLTYSRSSSGRIIIHDL